MTSDIFGSCGTVMALQEDWLAMCWSCGVHYSKDSGQRKDNSNTEAVLVKRRIGCIETGAWTQILVLRLEFIIKMKCIVACGMSQNHLFVSNQNDHDAFFLVRLMENLMFNFGKGINHLAYTP